MSEISQRLRQGREAVASGHLTLDHEKARAKLQQFRLPDPHMYVLQIVRAASVLGATKIEFVVEASMTACLFDAVFDEFTVDELWRAAFEERTSVHGAALHNLALGIASAQALNPAFIEVDSGDRTIRFQGDEAQVETGPSSDRTKIMVKEKFRLGHLVEFFESFVGVLPEVRALERVCEFSLMEVWCNGRPLRPALGPTITEEHDAGTTCVFGSRSLEGVRYILLRDDVMVDSMPGVELFLPAWAVQNSRVAPMDLTGLTLRERPASFPRDARSAYHKLLLDWLERNEVSPFKKRNALKSLCRELARGPAAPLGLAGAGPGTRDLLLELVGQPMFDSALLGNDDEVPLQSADHELIEYATVRAELPDGPGHVVHLPPHSDLIQLLPRVGLAVRDRTIELARRARIVRNQKRFAAQPPRAPRTRGPDGVVVRHGELRALVEPILGRAVGESVVLYEGRMLFEREGPLPYRIEVDGSIEPNEYFDNVDRDDEFEELTLLVLAAARRLFDKFADRPDHATLILNRLAENEFNSDLLGMLGYGRREAAKFLVQHQPPRDLDEDYRWLLREGGALADAKVFESTIGSPRSLREIIESPKAPLFAQVDSPRAQEMHSTRPILRPTPSRRRLVERVRPYAGEIHDALRREPSEDSLMQRPVFTPRTTPAMLHRHEVHDDRFSLELELLPDADPRQAEVFLVWRERLLGRHRWSSPYGRWRLIVRSDDFEPVATYVWRFKKSGMSWTAYDNVVEDELFDAIKKRFAKEVPVALADWRQSVVDVGRLEGSDWHIYFKSALLHGTVDDILLPAWRHDNGVWEPVLASLEDLAASARRNSALRYVRPGTSPGHDARDDELVLQLPRSINTQLLKLGPLAGTRITRPDENDISSQLEMYRRIAPPPRKSFPGAVVVETGTVDGFEVTTRLLPTSDEPTHVVEIVWQGRVLERVVGTEIGSFHTTIRGSAIGPDPTKRHAQDGRAEALSAAAKNARRAIIRGCQMLSRGEGVEPLREVLRALVPSLDGNADESWQDALVNAPLMQMSWKRTVALDEAAYGPTVDLVGYESLAQRAARMANATGDMILDEVARLLRAARGGSGDLVHEFTLAGLGWADEDQESLCVANATSVLVRRDHRLVEAARGGDERAIHFLASCTFTQINAYYQEISDANELELQRRLLRVVA